MFWLFDTWFFFSPLVHAPDFLPSLFPPYKVVCPANITLSFRVALGASLLVHGLTQTKKYYDCDAGDNKKSQPWTPATKSARALA